MIAQRYRLRLAPGHVVKPIGLLTLRPEGRDLGDARAALTR